jgi:phosphoribosylformylglycinamidine synthase subunit PurL
MTPQLITAQLVAEHGITQDEYQKILNFLGREPTITELGIFSVMWSEHCSYKSSKIYLKQLPTKGKRVLQGPGENAGIIDIGDGYAIVMKIESHNHPSQVEPYQGAATGVGGIIRDIFTMGARPIAMLNSLRFGDLKNPQTKRLVSGVVGGIAGYGNCMGIPTVAGEIYFDPVYQGNCLVNAMCVGIIKTDSVVKALAKGKGNPIIYVGSTTGRDGIHGASLLASAEFTEQSKDKRPNVQVGDPFMEKLLLEACLELIQKDLIVGMQDMGAAGLTSSSSEMASRGNTGIELDLDKVPRRETGMTPYEIMLSESQERMLVCGKKGKENAIKKIFQKWDLQASVVGKVTSGHRFKVKEKGKVVADIPVNAITDNAPIYNRPYKEPENFLHLEKVSESIIEPKDYNETILNLLNSPNIGSKRWVYKQYDHQVRTNTIVLPGQGDAAVLRIKENDKYITLTTDGNGRYCYLDPFIGGQIAVAEAARNLVCVGSQPIAVTNCLNFGNPEKPEIMGQFKQVIEGMTKACKHFDTPVISGNVSFYNETEGRAIYPTPVIGMLGIIEKDLGYRNKELGKNLFITMGFKNTGDLIVLLGETKNEMGGSEYLNLIEKKLGTQPPSLDLKLEKTVQQTALDACHLGILNSAHDCSEGGLGICLAESCITGNLGADIQLPIESFNPAIQLFSESQSRIIVSLFESHYPTLHKLIKKYNIPYTIIGKVQKDTLSIGIKERGRGRRDRLINVPVTELTNCYESAFGI